MKGLFSWVGAKSFYVEYVRPKRANGISKFSGWRLWNFAVEAITSFSTVPLRVWTYVGLAISLLSFSYATFIITRTIISGIDIPGYSSLIVTILFLGGVQIMGIGIIGEYLGRIYMETKQRPLYLVRQVFKK
jgi:glycosyltransferase involved in cell wall biosynthesis